MDISVIVEPVAGNGYRAVSAPPFGVTVEGTTREDVLRKMTEAIEARLRDGAELVTLHIPGADNPWLKMAGIFKDDPTFEEWQQAIADYRRQIDEDPDVP